MKLTYCISINIICILTSFLNAFDCGSHKFSHIKPKEVEVESKDRFLQSTSYEKIRIHFDYTGLEEASDELEYSFINKVKEIMNSVLQSFSLLVSLKPYSSKLIINECQGITFKIPDSVAVEGVAADLVLFVTVANTDETSSQTEAYAYSCVVDSSTGRPIAGVVALNINRVTFSKVNSFQYNYLLIMHEITHVLAFNRSLFKFFINPDTGSKKNLDETLREKVVINGVEKDLIVSYNVRKKAAEYFNCPSIIGVELESQGGTGSAGSHWEARTMLGDYMIAQSYSEVYISEITLALFEDSGWYKVNYYTGGLQKFGNLAGCEFLNKKCVEEGETLDEINYCSKDDSFKCLPGRAYRGVCVLGEYESSLPTEYQYYDDSTKGSSFIFADYCPIVQGYDRLDPDYFYSGSCVFGANELEKRYNQYVGPGSACFASSLFESQGSVISTISETIFCYKYKCNAETTSVIVTLGEKSFNCPGGGGQLYLEGFTGYIICPKYNNICTSEIECDDTLDCIIKKSTRRSPVNSYVLAENYNLIGTTQKAKPIGSSSNESTENTNTNVNNSSGTTVIETLVEVSETSVSVEIISTGTNTVEVNNSQEIEINSHSQVVSLKIILNILMFSGLVFLVD